MPPLVSTIASMIIRNNHRNSHSQPMLGFLIAHGKKTLVIVCALLVLREIVRSTNLLATLMPPLPATIKVDQGVAVIDGAGYIGSYLAPYLQSHGFRVTIFDKDPKFKEEDLDVASIVKVHPKNCSHRIFLTLVQ